MSEAKTVWQILINGQPLRPSGGEPYEFESRLEAAKCVHQLYGDWRGVTVEEKKKQ